MSSDTKKTVPLKKTSNKPRLISEGVLMYPERLALRGDEVDMVVKGGYVVDLGGRSFVLTVPALRCKKVDI